VSQAPSIDGVLIQWVDRLLYPGNRVVKVKPQSKLNGDTARHQRAAAIRERIQATVVRRAPQVMVKVTGGGRGMKAIAAHLRYISRGGRLDIEDERGETMRGKDTLHELADDWRLGGTLIFANPNIVCKLRHPETVEFVRREFLPQGARQTKRLALAIMTVLAISCHLWQGDHEGRCPMQSMNISLPDPLKQYVDGQILAGRYSSASEYVRELIRADEKRKAEEQLEAKLLEGLNSAETALTPADWKAIRKEAVAKVEARKHTR
jgi:putative addiction module CopG family antidote